MFEISQNGLLIRGVIKEFIFSKIAWSPKSSIWVAFRAASPYGRAAEKVQNGAADDPQTLTTTSNLEMH